MLTGVILGNKVAVFVYTLSNDTNNINREKMGNPEYVLNDKLSLLRIENKEKSHYIYIKNYSRLINLSAKTKNTEGTFCQYCEKLHRNEDFREHIRKCYKLHFNDGAILKVAEPGTYMKFENHKNKLVRPFIIYADTESTLEPNSDENQF